MIVVKRKRLSPGATAGIGIGVTLLIAAVGWFWFRQALDTPALVGLSLIIAGVIVVNVFSKSLPH